jgi:predicted nuclease with TOPRIM domain
MGPIDDHHDYFYKRLGEQDEKIKQLEFTVDSLKDMLSELVDTVSRLSKRASRLARANRMG